MVKTSWPDGSTVYWLSSTKNGGTNGERGPAVPPPPGNQGCERHLQNPFRTESAWSIFKYKDRAFLWKERILDIEYRLFKLIDYIIPSNIYLPYFSILSVGTCKFYMHQVNFITAKTSKRSYKRYLKYQSWENHNEISCKINIFSIIKLSWLRNKATEDQLHVG